MGSALLDLPTADGDRAPHDPTPHSPGIVDRVLDGIAWVCILLAGTALVFIIITFGWLVWGRYVMNNTPTWVEQSSLLLVAYITFLGAAVGVRRNTHLNIDFVREAFPPLPRQVMRHIADLLVMTFGGLMAWEGYRLVVTNLDRMIPMIGLSEAWRALPMAIGGALCMIFAGHSFLVRLTQPMRGSK
jgi:TRAP-type C4-dicarboxylate transport system permease small subunit